MQQDIINDSKTCINVEFYIFGNKLNFTEIGESIGIINFKTREASDFKIKEFAKDYWSIETGYEESTDIRKQVNKLLNCIKYKGDVINEIKQRFNAECGFNILINYDGLQLPIIRYEYDFIKFAANVNACIGLDC